MNNVLRNFNLSKEAKNFNNKAFSFVRNDLKNSENKGGIFRDSKRVVRRGGRYFRLVVIDVCSKYNFKKKIVVKHRDKEINKVFDFLGKRKDNNVLLVGEAGTGRKSVVYGMAEKIAHNTCPEPFKGFKVYEADCLQFVKIIEYPAAIEASIETLRNLYEVFDSKVIIYLKNIEVLYTLGLIGYFENLFSKYRFIGILDKPLDSIIDFSGYGFNYLYVENPKKEDLYDSVEDRVNYLQKAHNVSMTKKDFEGIVSFVHMITNDYNIGEILDVTDEALSVAKNRGLKNINVKCVLETYRDSIDNLLNSEESEIRFSAVHEIGHAIVAINHSIKIETVSIIPHSDGSDGGYNFFSKDNNYEYKKAYMNYIETCLGGYAGTLIEGFDLSNGALSDIKIASDMARAMHLYIGFDEESAPISYINEKGEISLEYMSDNMKDSLAEKVNRIIGDAEKRAEKIIREDKEKFDILVAAVIKKGFLTSDEIMNLYNGKITVDDLPNLKDLIF